MRPEMTLFACLSNWQLFPKKIAPTPRGRTRFRRGTTDNAFLRTGLVVKAVAFEVSGSQLHSIMNSWPAKPQRHLNKRLYSCHKSYGIFIKYLICRNYKWNSFIRTTVAPDYKMHLISPLGKRFEFHIFQNSVDFSDLSFTSHL